MNQLGRKCVEWKESLSGFSTTADLKLRYVCEGVRKDQNFPPSLKMALSKRACPSKPTLEKSASSSNVAPKKYAPPSKVALWKDTSLSKVASEKNTSPSKVDFGQR